MKTTLNAIRERGPCWDGWKKLLKYLGKAQADDEPLSILTILDSNGLNDALWCLRAVEGRDREIILYAVWCARRVPHLTDPRSVAALDAAERYARGEATDKVSAFAWADAWVARAAWAAWEFAVAARSSAGAAEMVAQEAELRRVCAAILKEAGE